MHLVYVYMYASLTPSEIVLVSWWIRYMWDQWCSKFQVVKAQTSKAVTDSWAPKTVMVSTDRHATSNSSSKAFGLEAKKAQHWTWLAYLLTLALSTWDNRATEMSRVWQGVSIEPTAFGKWPRSLASYNQILKNLLVGNMEDHRLDQKERHIQLPVLILETWSCLYL